MDFSNLFGVVSATLFILYVNLTEGYNDGYLRSYGLLQKQENIEKKRFLVLNTNIAWNPWSPWSVCSSSCRQGIQARGRACNTGAPSDCAGQNYDVKACNLGPCSVWNPWSPWSVCSSTCGDGLRARGRSCESGVLSDCDGPYYEKNNCTLKSCSAWIPWSSWSACSHSCGDGFQTRYRTCNTNVNSDCEGHSYDIQECNAVPCDGISSTSNPPSPGGHTGLDGKWSDWSTYSSCSVSCGNGTHTRNRSCLFNDHTAPHRTACFGTNSTTEPCNPGPCPVDGMWSAWSNYTACSKTCGGGVQSRIRQCEFLNGHPHGRDCIGNSSSSQECHTDLCPVDGTWSAWNNYTACSKTCGGGLQSRSRQCVFLNGHPHGRDCIGSSSSSQECHTDLCPVDGKWSDWSTYSSCSVSCGNGTHTRNRSCLFNHHTAPHGAACFGANSTTEPCNPGPCPVDGTWSAWSKYTHCSKTCGGGVQSRSRQCDFLNGHPHGRDCIGNSSSSQECQTELCPVDGTWSAWSNYTACSKTCGGGVQSRSRQCVFMNGYPHGRVCSGNSSSSQECHIDLCPAATKSNFTCATCGENPPELCEFVFEQNEVCPDPYCVNILRNPDSGQRTVERKCGSLQECKSDWLQTTSQMEACKSFNANFIYTQTFDCTYCCTTANCNENVHPDESTLYREN